MKSFVIRLAITLIISSVINSSSAEIFQIQIQRPAPAKTGYFRLGTTKNPAGHEVSVNSRSLLFDGQPVLPAMGEIYYSRVPEA